MTQIRRSAASGAPIAAGASSFQATQQRARAATTAALSTTTADRPFGQEPLDVSSLPVKARDHVMKLMGFTEDLADGSNLGEQKAKVFPIGGRSDQAQFLAINVRERSSSGSFHDEFLVIDAQTHALLLHGHRDSSHGTTKLKDLPENDAVWRLARTEVLTGMARQVFDALYNPDGTPRPYGGQSRA